jgi:hypothetical protein
MPAMAEQPTGGSDGEQEARRALLHQALVRMDGAPDKDRAADEVIRAIDAYMAGHPAAASGSREQPVMDFDHTESPRTHWLTVVVLGVAVLATIVVAIALAGGWPVAVAVVVVWVVALLVLQIA